MFAKLVNQIKLKRFKNSLNAVSSPFDELEKEEKNSFLKSMSKHALELYIKKSDVNKFTKLALSDPEDMSHNKLVSDLKLDEADPFESLGISNLVSNDDFLKDLGL